MRIVPVVVALFLLISLSHSHAQGLKEALDERIITGAENAANEDEIESLSALDEFYRRRDLQAIWINPQGLNNRGRELLALLSEAAADGLNPNDYALTELRQLSTTVNIANIAALEHRLSLSLMQFVSDLGQGRTAPHVADPDLYPYRQEVDKSQAIEKAAGAVDLKSFIDGYRPQTVRYTRAKAALKKYRALATNGGWEPLPAGETLKSGMNDPRVPALRARLELWGDYSGEMNDSKVYDDALVKAVKSMQYRHGLAQDGVVGKATLKELNVPVEDRVEQLIINLERRRWMPDDFGQRYIFVNLADFTLKLVHEPKTLLDMRVVIGKTYHKTPIFSKDMTYLEINPFWNVPPSIAGGEILPKLKKNPNYLNERNFTLLSDWSASAKPVDPLSIDWSQVSRKTFRWKLRQGPGDNNALGRIKFMLPNHFNIYLHDTPSKSKFTKAVRSFSHGCIRVHEPVRLADMVLTPQGGWDEARIRHTIASDERRIVKLQKPLPVHISYLTAWVNKDNSVHFRGDIYQRDTQLADTLLGARSNRFTNR
jgi:murein L,D-transpeptidase YcbB/YkuD